MVVNALNSFKSGTYKLKIIVQVLVKVGNIHKIEKKNCVSIIVFCYEKEKIEKYLIYLPKIL